jgi:hypothetical protein
MLALENPGLFDLSRYGVSHGMKVPA